MEPSVPGWVGEGIRKYWLLVPVTVKSNQSDTIYMYCLFILYTSTYTEKAEFLGKNMYFGRHVMQGIQHSGLFNLRSLGGGGKPKIKKTHTLWKYPTCIPTSCIPEFLLCQALRSQWNVPMHIFWRPIERNMGGCRKNMGGGRGKKRRKGRGLKCNILKNVSYGYSIWDHGGCQNHKNVITFMKFSFLFFFSFLQHEPANILHRRI